MFGASLVGRSLEWVPAPDPPGAWTYSVGGEVVAELGWSRSEKLVRAEVDDGVWRMRFGGIAPIRGALMDPAAEPRLVYAGSVRGGLARTARGREFVFFSQLDRHQGPWSGVDDADGEGILRFRGRLGGGRIWSDVTVTPDARYRDFVGQVLLTWGAVQVLRRRRPWLGPLSMGVSERAVQRALHELECR
jgi:hypothetical protein